MIKIDKNKQQEIDKKHEKEYGVIYTLNGIDYQIPFMKDDADGVAFVSTAFEKSFYTKTILKFSNNTEMSISSDEFTAFEEWFYNKRNSFFVIE